MYMYWKEDNPIIDHLTKSINLTAIALQQVTYSMNRNRESEDLPHQKRQKFCRREKQIQSKTLFVFLFFFLYFPSGKRDQRTPETDPAIHERINAMNRERTDQKGFRWISYLRIGFMGSSSTQFPEGRSGNWSSPLRLLLHLSGIIG